MLQEDLFEAVVGLPPNLFYGTGIPAAILVLNRDKPKARKGKVLFIDASREFREGSEPELPARPGRAEDRGHRSTPSRTWTKYARVVTLDEIEKNDWNLNISRYVETAEAEREGRRGVGGREAAGAGEGARARPRRGWTSSCESWGMTPDGWRPAEPLDCRDAVATAGQRRHMSAVLRRPQRAAPVDPDRAVITKRIASDRLSANPDESADVVHRRATTCCPSSRQRLLREHPIWMALGATVYGRRASLARCCIEHSSSTD